MDDKEAIKIEVCGKPIAKTFGLIKHYFIRLEHPELEIHPGQYKKGTHHNLEFTKGFEIYIKKIMCRECLQKLLKESNDMKMYWYYPFINCETLTKGLTGQFAISNQIVLLVLLILFLIVSFCCNYIYLLGVMVVLLVILYNNYLSSGTSLLVCHHLNARMKEAERKNDRAN